MRKIAKNVEHVESNRAEEYEAVNFPRRYNGEYDHSTECSNKDE
ncbi:9915_t:CDS:2 [Cetraspora pellucida]|uniref:9915_t:CDS:1 n=1 Tax=Cetraspora pellucida TaxID=1433469 RepID=A0ACA9L2W3_9GLOM|nr:9915_t:CDS:2 [Cetraspora pellucida]